MSIVTTQTIEETEEELIVRARQAVSASAWVVGECSSKWTEHFARGRTDASFGEIVGLTSEQVRQRRGQLKYLNCCSIRGGQLVWPAGRAGEMRRNSAANTFTGPGGSE